MFVARTIDEVRSFGPRNGAVTLGVFDGVHRGHRKIIDRLIRAKTRGQCDGCFVVTFDPHPLVVTHSRITPPMLTTTDERIALLSRFDLDGIFVLTFDADLADVDYRTFLTRYLISPFDMKRLVLGYDCHFGKNREGSPERVKAESRGLGFEAEIVPALKNGDEIVSSTKIRNALIEGDLAEANRLLGHPYLVAGRVVRGHGKGGGIGYPTANLAISDPYKLWPAAGVYAVNVDRNGTQMKGMMNIGRAPTVKNLAEGAMEIEVHLFDFLGDLYGENLRVFCRRFLREERRFPSVEALAAQLERDRKDALAALGTEDGGP